MARPLARINGYLGTGFSYLVLNYRDLIWWLILLAWRKLHNENVSKLEPSPDVVKKIKSRRMRWAGHVGRRGTRVRSYKVSVEKRRGKKTLQNFEVHERIILIWILEEVRLEGVKWNHLAQNRGQSISRTRQ
jgi:hypothetical protein